MIVKHCKVVEELRGVGVNKCFAWSGIYIYINCLIFLTGPKKAIPRLHELHLHGNEVVCVANYLSIMFVILIPYSCFWDISPPSRKPTLLHPSLLSTGSLHL